MHESIVRRSIGRVAAWCCTTVVFCSWIMRRHELERDCDSLHDETEPSVTNVVVLCASSPERQGYALYVYSANLGCCRPTGMSDIAPFDIVQRGPADVTDGYVRMEEACTEYREQKPGDCPEDCERDSPCQQQCELGQPGNERFRVGREVAFEGGEAPHGGFEDCRRGSASQKCFQMQVCLHLKVRVMQ